MNHIIEDLVERWPGKVTIVNGRPRHPQSQGLVERGNAKVEELIACRYTICKQVIIWSQWLPEIQCESIFYFSACAQFHMLQ